MTAVRIFVLLLFASLSTATEVYPDNTSSIKCAIERCLKNHRASANANGVRIRSFNASSVKSFYSRRSFTLAWSSAGSVREEALDLVLAVRDAEREGLDPADYHIDDIESAIGEMSGTDNKDASLVAGVDVLLTDAFLHYASDLHSGRVNPKQVNEEWGVQQRKVDLVPALQQALDSTGVREMLARLRPQQREYEHLKEALALYRSMALDDHLPRVSGVRRMVKGDSSARVITLRRRLSPWSSGLDTEARLFDDAVEKAVKTFQKQHGIEPDGVVGKETIAELNLTNEDRIRRIAINLERYRWFHQFPEERYLAVNIPAYELRVVENGNSSTTMRVVVGKSEHRTPLMSNAMTYIVLSPYWNVPQTIATEEILPKVSKDPGYLRKEKIRAFRKEGEKLSEIDSDAIDWTAVRKGSIKLRMDPGARNSLGSVKFMFPNYTNIYLHDTPAKSLFNKTRRHFSHGCVRVEQPVALAAHLLGRDSSWISEAIAMASRKGEERVVTLSKPVPVHLRYFTVWVDDVKALQFRKDIYGWDEQLSQALYGGHPLHKKPGVEQFASQAGKGNSTAAM